MHKAACTAILTVLVAISFLGIATADNVVAVKPGDWIEYQVTVTDNPTPIHNITWARLDVVDVEGPALKTDIQTRLGNGTLWLEPDTIFDVAAGKVGEGAIIPTDLAVGDVYYSQYEGNITVTGAQSLEVCGAKRAVLIGNANNTSYMWDKQTGIMVKATTKLSDCTVYSETSATNLWMPQILGLDTTVFYLLMATAVVVVVTAVVAIITHRKHRKTI